MTSEFFTDEELEELIVQEILKLKSSRKKVDTDAIIAGIDKHHGLSPETIALQISFILTSGKLKMCP